MLTFDNSNTDIFPNYDFTTINEVINTCTEECINSIDWDNPPPLEDIEIDLITSIRHRCTLINYSRSKGDKLQAPKTLLPKQIGDILLNYFNIRMINLAESYSDCNMLAIYKESGEDEGCYTDDEAFLERQIRRLNVMIRPSEINDVTQYLRATAPVAFRTCDANLVPVNNGIFDFERKILMPFSAEYIFIQKSKVDYNPLAQNVVIHNNDDNTDWDVDTWMSDLSDDPEIVNLLWQFLSSIVRPYVDWNHTMIFHSTFGNNGKGTLIELARQLVGRSSESVSLSSFSDRFGLEKIIKSNAILVDETPVGAYIDDISNLKAIITNDVITVDRKHKTPISFRFRGMTAFCWNGYVKIKDKSGSWYRRLIIISFDKNFEGKERTYIKHDYLHRKEVLEYVLYKVLNMNFYKFNVPQKCELMLAEYKEYNDSIRHYINDILDKFVWDFVPYSFIYNLYVKWFKRTNPSSQVEGKIKFLSSFKDIMNSDYLNSGFICYDKKKRINHEMDKTEPLIIEYELDEWKDQMYVGHDIDKICAFKKSEFYNGGLIRTNISGSHSDDN